MEVIRTRKTAKRAQTGRRKKKRKKNKYDSSLFIEKQPKSFEQDVTEKKEAVVVMFTKRTDECSLKVEEAIDAFVSLNFKRNFTNTS